MHGHHVYKAVWTPFVGKILDARREDEDSHDRHAVAVVFDSCIVGHLPREYSRIAWHFLQHGGARSHARLLAEDGVVVPCVYKFQGKDKLVVRLQEVIDKCN